MITFLRNVLMIVWSLAYEAAAHVYYHQGWYEYKESVS